MNIYDATEIAYKNGFEAGKKAGEKIRRDYEGWYAMELTEAIDNYKKEIDFLQKEIAIKDAEIDNLQKILKKMGRKALERAYSFWWFEE